MHLNILYQVVCFLKIFRLKLSLHKIKCITKYRAYLYFIQIYLNIYKQKNTIIVNFHQMSARRNTLQ